MSIQRLRWSVLIAALVVLAGALIASVSAVASPPTSKPHTATLKSTTLFSLAQLEFGQVAPNGDLIKLGEKPYTPNIDEQTVTFPDMTVRYSGKHLLLYLRVGYPCNNIYFSDGTGDANHVQVVNYGAYDFLGMADAGVSNPNLDACAIATTDYFTGGNFTTDVYPAGLLGP